MPEDTGRSTGADSFARAIFFEAKGYQGPPGDVLTQSDTKLNENSELSFGIANDARDMCQHIATE